MEFIMVYKPEGDSVARRDGNNDNHKQLVVPQVAMC